MTDEHSNVATFIWALLQVKRKEKLRLLCKKVTPSYRVNNITGQKKHLLLVSQQRPNMIGSDSLEN